MIGTCPGRVATVIGGQDYEVGPAEPPFQFGQPAVELLQSAGLLEQMSSFRNHVQCCHTVHARQSLAIQLQNHRIVSAGDRPTAEGYARKLAAAMCYVALVRLDSIYLQPFAEKLGDPLRLGGGRQRFQPVANYLQALKLGGTTKFFDITRDFISRYPQRGLVIVITPEWSA